MSQTGERAPGPFAMWQFVLISWCCVSGSYGHRRRGILRRKRAADVRRPGLEVRLVASEPMVRQPVAIEFDDRGPALGDPVPAVSQPDRAEAGRRSTATRGPSTTASPSRRRAGPRGATGSRSSRTPTATAGPTAAQDFVTGLNLASGLAFGYGGVFVLQPPYLLFYPDRDHDDRPDGDPEVLLTGFGMEDAHSVANSLTWGPDGWLYGLQGSTVTARIRGIEFQQGVWRYHPPTKRFELLLRGRRQHVGPRLRPPRPALRQHQRRRVRHAPRRPGGLLLEVVRQARAAPQSLHLRLLRPRPPRRLQRRPRARSAACSTRPTPCPPAWRGRYIAADLLGHSVHGHEVTPLGSTFQARQAGDLLRANDTWFAPSDLTLGPDGALYVADWHDRRTAHPDPDADWDRTNGRIFAIAPPGDEACRGATAT